MGIVSSALMTVIRNFMDNYLRPHMPAIRSSLSNNIGSAAVVSLGTFIGGLFGRFGAFIGGISSAAFAYAFHSRLATYGATVLRGMSNSSLISVIIECVLATLFSLGASALRLYQSGEKYLGDSGHNARYMA